MLHVPGSSWPRPGTQAVHGMSGLQKRPFIIFTIYHVGILKTRY